MNRLAIGLNIALAPSTHQKSPPSGGRVRAVISAVQVPTTLVEYPDFFKTLSELNFGLNSTAAMSSMRNATQRRNHRERGQPLERAARLGILEKHKVRRSMCLKLCARLVTQDTGLLTKKQKP